ncbi:MAG: ArsR family transcriptional regulator [Limnochordales bacterium]|nr:ArsR family transcriptional regulator [Limnochordales bacterium]
MEIHEQPTRAELLRLLKEQGEMTVKQLSEALGITPMGVRQHLEALLREGLVTYSWQRHGPGRPCQLFRLTPQGDELFPRNYASLAVDILRDADRAQLLDRLLQTRVRRMISHYRQFIPVNVDLPARVQALASARSNEGYFAEVIIDPDGSVRLVQKNCAIRKVAELFPALCRTEEAVLASLVNAEVEQVRCIARGASCCEFRLRPNCSGSTRAE